MENPNLNAPTSTPIILSLNAFIEKYDKTKLEYILSLESDELVSLIYDKNETDADGNKISISIYLKFVRKYLSEMYNNNCTKKTVYKQNENNRQYCPKSAQCLQYKLRGFLCSHLIDYDIINCHFQILLYICKDLNIPCLMLNNYCTDRSKFLQESGLNKQTMLITLNLDNPRRIKNNYLFNSFADELVNIKNQILLKSKFEFSTENIKNPISSKINRLLCYHENLILNRVISKYSEHISVLMFDGFMSKTELCIHELNALTTDYNVKWSIKQNDQSIQIPDDFEQTDLPFYAYQKLQFEKNVFHIKNNNTYFRILDDEHCEYDRQGIADLSEQFRIFDKKGESVSIFKEWMKDSCKRSYNAFVFDPSEKADTTKYINTFDGFACKDWDDNNNNINIDSFHALLSSLCNHEQVVIDYILDYLAHIIQKPAVKSGKIIVFRGIEGCGKDSFYLLMEKILGVKYCLNTENFEHIFGKYNIAIKNKIFLCLNETNVDDGRKYKDSLKAFATAERTKYADKNVKGIEQNNYSRLFLFANSSSPVNLEMTSRRYVIIKTDWSLYGDTEFWTNFYKNLNTKEYIKSVYTYLKKRPISEFKINNTPITEEYALMKENSIHPVVEYIKELSQMKSYTAIWEYDDILKRHTIKRNEFMELFEEYCDKNCEINDNLLKKKVLTNAIKDIGGITVDKIIKRDNKTLRVMSFDFPTIRKFYKITKL